MNTKPKLYQSECGLHYEDKQIAKQREAFCSKYKSCSLEITKLLVEVRAYNKNRKD
jgi:hypothetical protein